MAQEHTHDPKHGPLDGSTSGTIGGGGPETGGPTERPKAPEMPPVRPEDAASGRRAPDTIGATVDRDPPPLAVDIERATGRTRP